MVQIIIDTELLWKSSKKPLIILIIIVFLVLAAFTGYHIGKSSPINITVNIFPIDSGHSVQSITIDGVPTKSNTAYTFSGLVSNHVINVTLHQDVNPKQINSILTFTDTDFKSEYVHFFNKGDLIPEGNYTLEVIGWMSPWLNDEGWYEEGVRKPIPYRSAAWGNTTNIWINEINTSLSTLVSGSFDYENSWGSTSITLHSPSRVGIVIKDSGYSDNRGSAVFRFYENQDNSSYYALNNSRVLQKVLE